MSVAARVRVIATASTIGCFPAPAWASDPFPEDQAEVIIVTGERVPRTLRDTASSVDVTKADRIDAMSGADRIEQVLEQIPNVVLGSGGEGPSIRGQDTTGVLRDLPAFLGGNRPRTTLQVDGRAVSFNELVFGTSPLWDIERVEVFRTPQTTTQGINSIAGAIFIHSKDPTDDWQASGRAIAGDYDLRQASGVVSGPIIRDQLAFRLAGDLRRGLPSSKFTDNIRGADPNHDDYSLVRFKLLGRPMVWPGSRIEVTYSHSESFAPGLELIRVPFEERKNRFGTAAFQTNSDSLTAVLEHPLSSKLSAASTLSFGDTFVQRFAIPGLGEAKSDIRDLSGETVLDWNPEGPARLVAGLSHRRSTLDQLIDLSQFIGIGEFEDQQQSTGIFGEVSFEPLHRTTITLGLRYQHDRQDRSGAIGIPGRLTALEFDESFSAWLPKLSVAYDIGEDIRAGVLIQRAYNPGGITLLLDTGEHVPFGQESLWNYELFARARLAGGALNLMGNLFYTAMRDSQRYRFFAVSLPGGPPVTLARIYNVPRARTYGAEVTAEWRADPRLSLRASVGVLNTKITRADEASETFDGMEFARSPAMTASASVDWQPVDDLRLSAQVRHHGGYYSDDRETEALQVGKATIFDARAAWNVGPVTVFGYARNLFDTFRMRSLFNAASGTAHDPRELGLGIESRF